LFFFLYYPVRYSTISLSQVVLVGVGVLGLSLIGSAILSYSKSINNVVVFWILSYIIGGILVGVLSSMVSVQTIIIVFVLLCLISCWVVYKRLFIGDKQFDRNIGIVPFILSGIIMFLFTLVSDFDQAINALPFQKLNGLPDPFFFTLLTHSISVDNIFNAYYDSGAPINYQIIPFLAPAFLSKTFGVAAQVSLWGIWMPAYKLFGFTLIGHAILKHVRVGFQRKWWSLPLIIILLFTLAPINPKYVIDFQLSKLIFLGTGYLLPGGSPSFTLAIGLMGAVLFLFKNDDWDKVDGILFTILLALIIGTKTALFVPLGIYIGILALYKLKEDKRPLIYSICSAIIAAGIYILLFGNSGGLIKIEFNPGYYVEYFNKLLHTEGLFRGTINMLGALIIWGGIRFGILIIPLFRHKEKIPREIVAILSALLITILLPLLLRFKLLSPDGSILQDVTFDLIQFVRAAFFIITVVSIIILLNLEFKSKRNEQVVLILTFAYCSLTSLSLIYDRANRSRIPEDDAWRSQVSSECPDEGLFAMSGSRKYSPQLLAAQGIGPWWFSCKRADGSGYIMTNNNYYRAEIFDRLLQADNSKLQLKKMRKEGVNYLIAQPDNIEIFIELKKQKLLVQNDSNKWLFEIANIQ
jgi:hypothetical protein